jgi:hypothetical protein
MQMIERLGAIAKVLGSDGTELMRHGPIVLRFKQLAVHFERVIREQVPNSPDRSIDLQNCTAWCGQPWPVGEEVRRQLSQPGRPHDAPHACIRVAYHVRHVGARVVSHVIRLRALPRLLKLERSRHKGQLLWAHGVPVRV